MEINERQFQGLQGSVETGKILEDFVRHPGFQILKRELERIIEDSKHQWLNAKSALEAEEIRLKTKPFQEVYNLLTTKILQGRAAQETLNKLSDEGE